MFLFPCSAWHTGVAGCPQCLCSLPPKPLTRLFPVQWLTLNATYKRRKFLLFFHLASGGLIASILEKGYLPLYGGEVIICCCVSLHCYVAVPFCNFTIRLLLVHLGWLRGLCSLCVSTETCQLEPRKMTTAHADGDSAMTYGFFLLLSRKRKCFFCVNWDLSELSALHQGWISQLFYGLDIKKGGSFATQETSISIGKERNIRHR